MKHLLSKTVSTSMLGTALIRTAALVTVFQVLANYGT
jgi:hypothetical protein